MGSSAELPVLHQFCGSHFNEKARWALDWKGIAHRRRSHLPGPHRVPIQRLSGQTATPVLVLGGEVVAGSARIVERLEALQPQPPLHPADPGLRRRALAIQSEFDAEVGPATRTALFSVIIGEPGFLCRIFAAHRGPLGRAAYRALFPVARRLMARAHDTGDRTRVARAFELSRRALERVAREAGGRGQLVGDAFSVADLAAAALLAPLVNPPHPDIALPEPLPESVQAFLAGWADHDGAHWVREQYARHRPGSAQAERGLGAVPAGARSLGR